MQIFSRIACLILGIKVEVRGKENLVPSQQYVFVMNHQSNYDVVLGSCLKLKNTIALGKFEIMFFPLFGVFFFLSGNILIKRKKRKSIVKSLNKIDREIKDKNQSIVIMPEGTRSHQYKMGDFKLGAFQTAIRNQIPVLPIVASPWHQNINLNKFQSGKVTIQFLEPIPTNEYRTEDSKSLSFTTKSEMEKYMKILDKP